MICFDLSQPSTLDGVKRWKDDIDNKVRLVDDSPIPVILLANKVFRFLFPVVHVTVTRSY
jgi:hypothetical protein